MTKIDFRALRQLAVLGILGMTFVASEPSSAQTEARAPYLLIDAQATHSATPAIAEKLQGYEIFLRTLATANSMIPPPNEADSAAMRTQIDPLRPLSTRLGYYDMAYPNEMHSLEQYVREYGFSSRAHWALFGDDFVNGMALIGTNHRSPGFLAQILNHSEYDIAGFKPEKQRLIRMAQSFDQLEIDWFADNHARYQTAISQ